MCTVLRCEAGRAAAEVPRSARYQARHHHPRARPTGARSDRVQEWADHNAPRTTKRYNRRRGALDGSSAYDVASSLAGLLEET